MTAEEEALRRHALRALDRLLTHRPPCTVQEAVEATRSIVALRDHLTARRRAEERQEALDAQLARVNAVLSLTWSGAVPIHGFRYERLVRARDALAADGTG